MTAEAAEADIDEEIIVTLSDYLDNVLPLDQRADVEAKIANDAAWKSAHAEMVDARDAVKPLSGLQKARPDVKFTDDVTGLIEKRSAGRFFGRRTFGDRVPFVAILVVALIGLGILAYVMWSSPTGSLKVDKERAPSQQGSAIVDKP
jgi:anti-sigma factor RsiW